MTTLRSIVDKINGMRFMVESLELCSSLAKRHLMSQEYLRAEESLANEIGNVSEMFSIIKEAANANIIEKLRMKLGHILDIRGTLNNISNAAVLDDIQLFEVKRFALLVSEISELLNSIDYKTIVLPSLENVIDILDPDKTRIAHFYIYPSYNEVLAGLRKKQEKIKDENPEEYEEIRIKCLDIEDDIRQDISRELYVYAKPLKEALDSVAYIDILLAKALQANKMNLCKPKIVNENTLYKGLFNPQLKEVLMEQNKDFQAIDICLYKSPCLITGANMAGKTVVLKTIALAQYMFQFGFFVPATDAEIVPVEDIMLSIGDDQSEMNGLSSFAAEMMNINAIIKAVHSGKKVLALIDELARTTNPEEGRAIVNATIDILEAGDIRSLVTTHYNGLNTSCRKLRVKGLMTDKITKEVTIENINDYMDYSLVENNDDVVPMEALRIAAVLGIDEELLEKADKYTVR